MIEDGHFNLYQEFVWIFCLPLWRNGYHVRVNQTNTLGPVFWSHLCHSGQET